MKTRFSRTLWILVGTLTAVSLLATFNFVTASGQRKAKTTTKTKLTRSTQAPRATGTATPVVGRTAATPAPHWLVGETATPETPLVLSGGEWAVKHKSARADEPDKAMQYFLQKRLPEGATDLPMERYLEAQEQMQQLPLYSTADNRLVASRAELRKLAPEQQRLGAWTWLGPGNIGGRTRSIIIHPQDVNVMYAAGVTGGVWKSTNAGQSWTPVSDLISHVSVSALAFEPNNPNVIYAGTGEGYEVGSSNGVNITGSYRGLGIYKSTDAGANWTRLPNTDTADFYYINDLVVSTTAPQRVYAATATGVWRSADGGQSWTRVHNPIITGGCLDLAIRTDQPNDVVLVACGTRSQARVYRNADAGGSGTWAEVLADTGMGRTTVSFAPSNQNVAYALSTAFSGAFLNSLHAIFRSTDGGQTWEARARNTDANKINRSILSIPALATGIDCRLSTVDSFSGQGWYDLALAVDPADENRVWVGGIDVARTDDGGANWGIAGFAYDYSNGSLVYGRPNQLHPDQHFITFHPQYNGTTNQQMFVGNDGGIWRSDNARATVGTGPTGACSGANSAVRFTALNNNYGVTQFYHGVVFPDGKSYFGGTQDNGTPFGTDAGGPNQWRQILLADGGYGAVDFLNPSVVYASSQGGNFRRSTDGGATFITATAGLSGTFSFITPLMMDPSDPRRLYTGGEPVWRTDNGMANWTSLGSIRAVTLTTGTMSALAVAPTDANHVMIGMNDGNIIRTTRALSLSASNPLSSTLDRAARPRTGFVSWLAYDPYDRNIAYATYSTFGGGAHVWRTTNGGESWTGIDSTGTAAIPDIPVHCIVVDTSNSARLYVGTDLGVFVTTDGGATWAVENTGFANAMTESLVLNTVGGVTSLYAFTHGRGVFKVTANMSGCNFALGESNRSVGQTGSDLTVNVNVTPNGCPWKAESNVPWITLQPGAGGASNGTVGMKVTANTSFGTRIGTVAIAGRSFTVTQTGVADIDAPVLRVTLPSMRTVNTTAGTLLVTGTASDNQRVTAVNWRSDRGLTGTATGTTNWTIASLPVLTGRNAITITATDEAGNVSNAVVLTINSMPSSVLTTLGLTTANLARIASDAAGNVYIAEFAGHRVRRLTPNGTLTTIAGTGTSGFSGDGAAATLAQLNTPVGVAVDGEGNVYISDYGNQRVRKITVATGRISTVAGTGTAGFSGDGGPGASARINFPESLAVDKLSNLYIADSINNRVRKVEAATGNISTVVGTGAAGFGGDDGPAKDALLRAPLGLAFDTADNLYIGDANARIRRVAAGDGIIKTVVGTGTAGFAGDGGPATSANIGTNLIALTLDSLNNLYFTDLSNQRVRRVDGQSNIITTVTGNGIAGFTPDGAGAAGASIGSCSGVAIDPAGLLVFGDRTNNRVRRILTGIPGDTSAPTIIITAPAPGGQITSTDIPLILHGTASDNGTIVAVRWSNDRGGSGATSGTTNWTVAGLGLQPGLNNLTVTAWDISGNAGSAQLAVTYTPTQVVTTIAGTGASGNTGDDGPGTAATLSQPRGVAIDSKGNILVADTTNRRIRRIAPNGVITAFAGTGFIGSSGDGGPALEATLSFPNAVIVDKDDNVYISDQFSSRVRKVTPDGKISTVAGSGDGVITGFAGGFGGDGGPATQALLNQQVGITVDKDGHLLIADRLNHRIRRVDARTGIITTIVGTSTGGYNGDAIPATDAALNAPTSVVVDGAGNLYIADTGNQRIRRVNAADGRISTIAGRGSAGFSGDDGPAQDAQLNLAYPALLAFDAAGDLYCTDLNNNRVRKITLATGIITTVAGSGATGFNGDGTTPGGTSFTFPVGVAFDAAGNMVISDTGNQRVRRVRPASAIRTLANVSAASFTPTGGLAAEEITAAFGTNLAGSTVAASSLPLPLTLAGTTLRVRDSLSVERLAPLFFVSADQINYLVPSGTANGIATVTITNALGEVATGTVTIANVAPSLFSANATGAGLATAIVFRRTAAGVDSYEAAVRFDTATSRFVAVPIDLGPEGDQVFLIPFGTGFRGLTGLANVQATIGGVAAPTIFAGAVPGLIGADQANLRIDRGLIGRGEVDVVLTVDGKATNTVRVAIK